MQDMLSIQDMLDSYSLLVAFCMKIDLFRYFFITHLTEMPASLLYSVLMSTEVTAAEGHLVTLPAAYVDLAWCCPWSWSA